MAQKKKTPASKNPSRKPDDASDVNDEAEGEEGEEDENDIDGRINAIVTNRLKRFEAKQNEKHAELMTALQSLKPKAEGDEDGDEDSEADEEGTPVEPVKGKKSAKVDPAAARRMTRLERELKEEKEARKAAERERAEAQDKAKRDEEKSIFSSALVKAGVNDPALSRGALQILMADGKIIRDEDGKIRFKGVDKYGLEANLDPDIGVSQWLKADGKAYVPAIPAGGSGSDGARHNGNSTNMNRSEYQKLSPQQRAAIELERATQGLPPLT